MSQQPEEKQTSPSKGTLRRGESVRDRRGYNLVHKASMRHRSIVLDSNDADLVQLRLAFAKKGSSTIGETLVEGEEKESSPVTGSKKKRNVLSTSESDIDASARLDLSQMAGMKVVDLLEMLTETGQLEEQASIVHCLWMKFGPDYPLDLNDQRVSVRTLMEEIYTKACDCRDWALTRLTAGLLNKRLEELGKAVTHLLVRQKQITIGMPSKKEEAITCPKTNEELKEIMHRAYADDPNSFTLSQEIIVSLGSLVRTEPKLFVEMFRLRIGLIIQVLASELARIRELSAADALQNLLTISPFELKSMLLLLLSGRLLEDNSGDDETAAKETRTGIGSFRKHIEERKSLRKSMHMARGEMSMEMEEDEDSLGGEEGDDFQFGIWLRHRRIDGALNRVPNHFYAIVEALWLFGRLDSVIKSESPRIPWDSPVEVDAVIHRANQMFVEHNKAMETIVLECCGSGHRCNGARGVCVHFYDSAPAGEYGTSHYLIKALVNMFT